LREPENGSALPFDLANQLREGESRDERESDGSRGHAEQACSNAGVQTSAEGEVTGRSTSEVDLVGIVERFRIVMGGGKTKQEEVAFANYGLVEGKVGGRGARDDACESNVAHELLDGLVDAPEVPMHFSPLPRMLEQSEPDVAQHTWQCLRQPYES
jgi:hypothetical protein